MKPATASIFQTDRRTESTPPVPLPEGHIGPAVLPGTNRHIWWTGRVAIGLRYERGEPRSAVGESALWVQNLMLTDRRNGDRHQDIHGQGFA